MQGQGPRVRAQRQRPQHHAEPAAGVPHQLQPPAGWTTGVTDKRLGHGRSAHGRGLTVVTLSLSPFKGHLWGLGSE